ncbi:hypothetical protein BGX28_003183 [Mortierella sp. GBA30]|nr:hypothetical protein BGX28_003183 [Mortierella sp. GBA30]
MDTQNVLDLPEIRAIVGSFLSCQDLTICAQVARAWHSSFAPLIWRDTVLRPRRAYSRYYVPPPSPASVRANSHFIRTLFVESSCSFKDISPIADGCDRLEHIRLSATASTAQSRKAFRSTRWLPEGEEFVDLNGDYEASDSEETVKYNNNNVHEHKTWSTLGALVYQNRNTLKSLELIFTSGPPTEVPTRPFWNSLVDCFPPSLVYSSTRLTSLTLAGREMQWSDLMLVWRAACPYLETLKIMGVNINDDSAMECSLDMMKVLPPPALRHLTLTSLWDLSPALQYDLFIAPSPKLKRLVWKFKSRFSGGIIVPTCEQLQDLHHWPELMSMEIESDRESLSAMLVSTVLESIGAPSSDNACLESLILRSPQVDDTKIRLLSERFASMRVLDLKSCADVTGAMVQEILSSCSSLESISANSIHAHDIQQGEPWVCLGLKEWTIFINLMPPFSRPLEIAQSSSVITSTTHTISTITAEQHKSMDVDKKHRLQQVVFERLGMLTRLELLDLDRYFGLGMRKAFESVMPLDWRLEAGLDKLSGLSRVSTVRFWSAQRTNMSKDAIFWMLEHWHHLKTVEGRLGSSKVDHAELTKVLRQSGINVL